MKSLLWRVWLPWGLATGLVCLGLGGLQADRQRLQRQAQRGMVLHNEVGQAAEKLLYRHLQHLRRCEEARREPQTLHAAAMVGWIAERYADDMKLATDRLQGQLRQVKAGGDDQTALAVGRLLRQLGRLRQDYLPMQAGLQGLRQALQSGGAAERRQAQAQLDQADRGVVIALEITGDMVRAIAAAEPVPSAEPSMPWVGAAWLLGVLLLWSTARPLLRLRQLARQLDRRRAMGTPAGRSLTAMGPPRSAEEATLVGSLHDLNRAHGALQSQLQSLGTAAERQRLSLRRAEHDLLLLRSYNDNLVNSLRSAVVVTDAAGRLSSINRTARATLGLGDADLGKPFASTRLHLAMQAQHPTLIDQMDEQAVRFEAVSCDDPAAGEAGETGAGTCLLDVRVAPYRDEGGTPRGLLVVADDVTEAVQIKHQLLRSERLAAVGRLSAQVAHEIRNPLSAIGLNTELLEEEFVGRLPRPDGDEARELLRGIGTEVERLTEVTEAYLQLARLPRPQLRQVDVNQVVADLFVMLRSEMRAHAIGVDLDLASPAPRALLDPGQLRQALHNVVRNSREAMPQGGKLWVRTEQVAPSGIRILVDDTGGGIQETVRHRACEPFFSTKPAGTGLGLSLTQQILVEHGGSVQLTPWQSPNEAPGSRVELLFP